MIHESMNHEYMIEDIAFYFSFKSGIGFHSPLLPMSHLSALLVAFLLFVSSTKAQQVELGQTFTGKIMSVTDGDTYDVRRSDGQMLTVRLHGVDATAKDLSSVRQARHIAARQERCATPVEKWATGLDCLGTEAWTKWTNTKSPSSTAVRTSFFFGVVLLIKVIKSAPGVSSPSVTQV